MNITEFEKWEIDEAQAYTIGLIYPLIKFKRFDDAEYIIGSVNHNHNSITKREIDNHFLKVNKLLNDSNSYLTPEIKTNKSSNYSITNKLGFSLVIDILDFSKQRVCGILNSKISYIMTSNKEIKKYFIRGCFDGRSSWDKTAKYISLDVDRDLEKQEKIKNIIESLGIQVNINNRDINHKKNDQIRIKTSSVTDFLEKVGFYSQRRLDLIKKGIEIE